MENDNSAKIITRVDSDLKDLIPDYLCHREDDINAIDTGLVNEDFETIRIVGHSMKGSGAGYGFNEISLIGGNLEKAAQENNINKIKELKNDLSSYLKKIELVYV